MLERLFWRVICIIQKSVVPLHNESHIIQRPMKIKRIAFYELILLAVAAVTSPVSASDPQKFSSFAGRKPVRRKGWKLDKSSKTAQFANVVLQIQKCLME